MFLTPNFEGSFHPLNIDDRRFKKRKKKYGSNIFLKTTFMLNFIKIGDSHFGMLEESTSLLKVLAKPYTKEGERERWNSPSEVTYLSSK